ncbi:MAG: hypothetical protein WBG46_01820 [Nonlabens sp.]
MKYIAIIFLLVSWVCTGQNDHLGRWKYDGLMLSSIDTLYTAPEDVPAHIKTLENRLSIVKIYFINDSIVDYQIDELVENKIYDQEESLITLDDEWEFELLSFDKAQLHLDLGSIYLTKYEEHEPADKVYLTEDSYEVKELERGSEIGKWVIVDTRLANGKGGSNSMLKLFESSVFNFKEDGNMSLEFKGSKTLSEYFIEDETNLLVSTYPDGRIEREFIIVEISEKHMIMRNKKRGFYFYLKRK